MTSASAVPRKPDPSFRRRPGKPWCLGMQGKKAEAHAIGEKMSAQEQDAFMKGTMTIFTACAGKPR